MSKQSIQEIALEPQRQRPGAAIGDLVQVNPSVEVFGGCIVVVTEVKSWGIQGYVQSAGIAGQQYIRLKDQDYEPTGGQAVWRVSHD